MFILTPSASFITGIVLTHMPHILNISISSYSYFYNFTLCWLVFWSEWTIMSTVSRLYFQSLITIPGCLVLISLLVSIGISHMIVAWSLSYALLWHMFIPFNFSFYVAVLAYFSTYLVISVVRLGKNWTVRADVVNWLIVPVVSSDLVLGLVLIILLL